MSELLHSPDAELAALKARHIPAQSIWAHEKTEEYEHPKLRRISYFKEILDWI